MRLKSINTKREILLGKNVVVADIVSKKTQQHISTTCGCIAKSLQVHQLAEWRIKEVNNREYKIPCAMNVLSQSGKFRACQLMLSATGET
jgi:hypothetical protein